MSGKASSRDRTPPGFLRQPKGAGCLRKCLGGVRNLLGYPGALQPGSCGSQLRDPTFFQEQESSPLPSEGSMGAGGGVFEHLSPHSQRFLRSDRGQRVCRVAMEGRGGTLFCSAQNAAEGAVGPGCSPFLDVADLVAGPVCARVRTRADLPEQSKVGHTLPTNFRGSD